MNQDPVSSPSNAHDFALFPRISPKKACIIGAVLGVALLGYTQFGRLQDDEKIWDQLKSINAPVRQKQLRKSNEPWSQVSGTPREPQIVVEPTRLSSRSRPARSSNITTVSMDFGAPGWMYPWIGTKATSAMVLVFS